MRLKFLLYAGIGLLSASIAWAQEPPGRLELRGKIIVNTETDNRIGGFSGVTFEPNGEGQKMLVISDRGYGITSTLKWKEGELVGLSVPRVSHILDQKGRVIKGIAADVEAIEPDGKGGYWLSFEEDNRLWHMQWIDGQLRHTGETIHYPLNESNLNSGVEGFVVLDENRIFAIAEAETPPEPLPQEGYTLAMLWNGESWENKVYPITGGFKPTDMAKLPDGSFLVLERALSLTGGLKARLQRLPASSTQEEVLTPELVADITHICEKENMEGLDVWETEDGKVMLIFTADDNYRLWQKTLVVVFEYKY